MSQNFYETGEFVLTGIRHNKCADVLNPLLEQGDPVDVQDVNRVLGCYELYLKRISNDHHHHAIGVFTRKKQLGYLWVCEAYAMSEWMTSHKVDRVRVVITRVCAEYGFMIARPMRPMKLTIRAVENLFLNMDWCRDLPRLMHCRKGEELDLKIMMLEDSLKDCQSWSDELREQIEDVIENLRYDLSALSNVRCVSVFFRMRASPIREVREASDRLVFTMIHRGSPEAMAWWMETCLPEYFRKAAEDKPLLRMYEYADYTLERVESLLREAPEHLFDYYVADREHFATHLYYAMLPHELYTRLLTLLAIREMMLAKGKGTKKTVTPSAVAACFRFPSEFTREKVDAVVKKYYHGAHAELALIEVTLFDHNQLKKRNSHKPFVRALVAWGILDVKDEEELTMIVQGIKDKHKRLPKDGGYLDWGYEYLNDKNACISISKELGETMQYRY